jgi:hypothetical protein
MATRLESGPARTDMFWILGYTVLCLGLGAYFFYDWQIGYPAKNRAEAARILEQQMGQLNPKQTPPATLASRPTKAAYEELARSEKRTLEDVNQTLGPPLFERAEAGITTRYYASEWGMVGIPFRGGLAEISDKVTWRPWYKSEDDVEAQKYFGVLCTIVGLYFAYRAFRAGTLHVTLDDTEMNYGGRRIPTSAMKRLVDYSPKGWVDLYYDIGTGDRKLRLDNQKVAKFDEIIETLCAIKGFPDPRREVETDEQSAAT